MLCACTNSSLAGLLCTVRYITEQNGNCLSTCVATMGPRAMAPSLLSYFSIVSVSWFTFAIVSICCGPLTCLLLATPLCLSYLAVSQLNKFEILNGSELGVVDVVNPRRMRKGYGSGFVCVCVCVCVCVSVTALAATCIPHLYVQSEAS